MRKLLETALFFVLLQVMAACIMFFSGFAFVFPNPDWNTEVDMSGYYVFYGVLEVAISIITLLKSINVRV